MDQRSAVVAPFTYHINKKPDTSSMPGSFY
jgi:hypothetical protein